MHPERVGSGAAHRTDGATLVLAPDPPHALQEPVLVGEVSTVNDDAHDNFFLEPVGRFPQVEEDEEPYRLLTIDYPRYYKHARAGSSGY